MDQVDKPSKPFERGRLEHKPRANPARSGVIVPGQIHGLLTNYQASARKTLGSEFDLEIEISENLGPIPRDYAKLLLDVLHQCVKYICPRSTVSPSVEVRLSEVRKHAQLSFVVLEIGNRNLEVDASRKLSEELVQLRECTEQWNGFLLIDGASHDKTVFRVALPIVTHCS